MIRMRIRGDGGDVHDKGSPRGRLTKARNKVVGKLLALLTDMRRHMAFVPFEPIIGGKFPVAAYQGMIAEVQQ